MSESSRKEVLEVPAVRAAAMLKAVLECEIGTLVNVRTVLRWRVETLDIRPDSEQLLLHWTKFGAAAEGASKLVFDTFAEAEARAEELARRGHWARIIEVETHVQERIAAFVPRP
jgi:hypothetical protein